jgi:hypothetical protein
VARPPRPRRERREQERALRKDVRNTERLARQLPGGTAEAPIDVPAPGVAEIEARGTPCPQCGGELHIVGDHADSSPRGVLRELRMQCRLCHTARTLWFRVRTASPN